jgi:hypothetical protein
MAGPAHGWTGAWLDRRMAGIEHGPAPIRVKP